MITVKRIYEPVSQNDGYRILVDRLWPRGISKEKANIDLWLKEIAPSTELRKWFEHDENKWYEFEKKYMHELTTKNELLEQIKLLENEHNTITLLYGARDTKHNNAVVIAKNLK